MNLTSHVVPLKAACVMKVDSKPASRPEHVFDEAHHPWLGDYRATDSSSKRDKQPVYISILPLCKPLA